MKLSRYERAREKQRLALFAAVRKNARIVRAYLDRVDTPDTRNLSADAAIATCVPTDRELDAINYLCAHCEHPTHNATVSAR